MVQSVDTSTKTDSSAVNANQIIALLLSFMIYSVQCALVACITGRSMLDKKKPMLPAIWELAPLEIALGTLWILRLRSNPEIAQHTPVECICHTLSSYCKYTWVDKWWHHILVLVWSLNLPACIHSKNCSVRTTSEWVVTQVLWFSEYYEENSQTLDYSVMYHLLAT